MNMNVTKASGRGKCAECMKEISEGEKQLVLEKGGPYYLSNRYCNKCGKEYLKQTIARDKVMLNRLGGK